MTHARRMMVLALGLTLLPAALAAAELRSKLDGDKPLATAKHDNGLTVEVLEVKPDTNKKLLTIRWRYRNPTNRTIVVLKKSPRFKGTDPRPVTEFVRATYYLEGDGENVQETYRHSIVNDTGRKLWATPHIGLAEVAVKPRGEIVFWAKFSLPVKGQSISLHLPDTEPIENLPIQQKSDK